MTARRPSDMYVVLYIGSDYHIKYDLGVTEYNEI